MISSREETIQTYLKKLSQSIKAIDEPDFSTKKADNIRQTLFDLSIEINSLTSDREKIKEIQLVIYEGFCLLAENLKAQTAAPSPKEPKNNAKLTAADIAFIVCAIPTIAALIAIVITGSAIALGVGMALLFITGALSVGLQFNIKSEPTDETSRYSTAKVQTKLHTNDAPTLKAANLVIDSDSNEFHQNAGTYSTSQRVKENDDLRAFSLRR